jgi:8-oxo-dGTP pyrophosphatase MutT (NUDIX family)
VTSTGTSTGTSTASQHRDALAVLSRWSPPTTAQAALRRQYLEHLQAHPDGTSRGCSPAHLTCGAVVLDPTGDRVLLTLHAKARRWFHLGGHLEPGDPGLAAAALREATEESGTVGLDLDPVPLQLDAHEVSFCGDVPRTRHLDVRFLAVAPPEADVAVSEESLDVAWWPVAALPTDERSLHELVDLARARLAVRLDA